VVAVALLKVSPKEALAHIRAVRPSTIAACSLAAFVVIAFQALRWNFVMGPLIGLRYADAFRAQLIGVLFNAVLPMRGGDLLRVQYLGRRTGKSRATILGTEIVDRWIDWSSWATCLAVLSLVEPPPKWFVRSLAVFFGLLLIWAVVMIVLLKRERTDPTGWVGRNVEKLRTGLLPLKQPRIWLLALFVAPLPWLWETMVLAWLARQFGMDLTAIQSFAVLIAFNLATVVPSPGAVGTIEAGGTAAMVLFGYDQSRAMAFLLVYHFTQLLPGIIGGGIVFALESRHIFGSAG
jgi:uncharacterized membrane protein YbhN (UPF0104 family)